ncbi:MAG: succinate dehydrogenase cytochrome b subunit [Desulfoprunum sp.]|nr:succinate dehydrogenase cytochrome b subunit [Desulfoprunum sp.]
MWFIRFVSSSIGKKLIMGMTGLLLFLFLCTHAAGNATIYMSSKIFQGYADELHSHPLIVIVFSLAIFILFVIHVGLGLYLFLENRRDIANRYAVTTRVVENSFASRTMPYTGLFILLFVLVHVFSFTFGPKDVLINETVKTMLSGFFYGLFYIVSFAILAIHLSHGFWSMLQTFGINHPRYNVLIARLTYIIPVSFLLLFGGIPLYFMSGAGASF